MNSGAVIRERADFLLSLLHSARKNDTIKRPAAQRNYPAGELNIAFELDLNIREAQITVFPYYGI